MMPEPKRDMTANSTLILNVDDNDGARYAKTRIMQSAGFRVIEAANGTDALAMVREEEPSLVLLDVKLPDINGIEVCRRIKSDPDTSCVLVLQTSAAPTGCAASRAAPTTTWPLPSKPTN
jgi:CheY-like chemotaxis protein